MIKQRRFRRIFFGWWTVLGGGTLGFWVGTYATYGIAALLKPISADLGINRATASLAASIARIDGGLEAPAAGWATDRFGPRGVIFFGILVVGISLILMKFVDSLWAFYLVWGVLLATGHNMSTRVPLDTAISNWFVKKRGLATSVRWLIGGLSGALGLPIVAWLVVKQGWRMACLIGGVFILLFGLPIARFSFKPRRPEYYGLLPDGAIVEEEIAKTGQTIERGVKYAEEVQEVEFTLRQAMRTPSYWLLLITVAAHGMAQPIVNLHAVPFLTDIGIDPLQAAAMVAMLIFVGLPIRVVGGLLADRVSKRRLRFLFAGAYLLQASGFAVFLLNQTVAMIYAWFIIYGIGNGLAYGLMVPIWPRYFGRKAIGSIRGTETMFATPVGIAAPVYAGWVYDTTGSYLTAFTVVMALILSAAVLMMLVVPPKPPAEVGDVRKII